MDRIRDQSRLEIHARWMLLNQTLESRRAWIEGYREKNGPAASIELKAALTQENYRLKRMSEHDIAKLIVADEIEQNKVLHKEPES